MFRANDGQVFNTEAEAIARDKVIEDVRQAMEPLGELPADPECAFANGDGYYQHTADAVERTKRALLAIFEPLFASRCPALEKATCPRWQIHPSWFGRMIDGTCPPLERAYSRLCRIDGQCREFGQPYFADNPEKANLWERKKGGGE